MPTNKKLTGMYTVVLDNENGNIGSNTYNRVLVAYDFKDDYTGQWLELFYKDGTDEPFIGHGGNAGGEFKYTVYADGKVSFIFERPDIALQRGTVTLLSDRHLVFHYNKNGEDYSGLLLDEKSANEIRTLMRQFKTSRSPLAMPLHQQLLAKSSVATERFTQVPTITPCPTA